MTQSIDPSEQLIFLGLADFVEEGEEPFPIGSIDVFSLSQHKLHIVYPGIISSNEWIILVKGHFLNQISLKEWMIQICDENDNELGNLKFPEAEQILVQDSDQLREAREKNEVLIYVSNEGTSLVHFKSDSLIMHPGEYAIYSIYKETKTKIGSVYFHYQKAPSLTLEQIKAIESDPNSARAIGFTFGCKFCETKLNVYTGLIRSQQMEDDGFQWYSDIEDRFICQCGKTNYSLEYIRESMHGLLLKDFNRELSGLSYVRQYGHQQVTNIISRFKALLDKEKREEPVQKFLEKNPILLSRFTAKRLFVKPDIIGKFVTDFVILDSKNQLWFIELERPSLQLFKKDAHPTSGLMHAYEQVNDWLQQYSKYSGAILSSLELKEENVVAVRGAVIAGRSSSVSHEVLQRHLSNPPYSTVEFMTLDDLAASLLTISRKLA